MKVSELEGRQLDYWVCKTGGLFRDQLAGHFGKERDCEIDQALFEQLDAKLPLEQQHRPSTNWAQGGPIIEHEKICLHLMLDGWSAFKSPADPHFGILGQTALIAAMRCYVASKFGEAVPEDSTFNWKATAKFDGGYEYRTYGTSTDRQAVVGLAKKAVDVMLERSMQRLPDCDPCDNDMRTKPNRPRDIYKK